MGKSDRAFIFGLVALLLGLGLQHQQLYNCLFALVLLLLALTIKNRIASALAEVTQLDYLKSKE